jgi:RNA polymerase sigma factor (sigma-70 family)
LLDHHAQALVLFARQWCAQAEDVVQESFVKLAAQRVAPRQPLAWLYQVVRRGAISRRRAEERRARHESTSQRSELWFRSDPGAGLDAESATQALQKLPLAQREIIVAHLWGGLTFADIAKLVGTSTSSAHRLYLAGLAELRHALDEPCTEIPNTTPP